jgi:hypothetical protein
MGSKLTRDEKMRTRRVDRKTELYELAENFFRRSSEEARQRLLETLENEPDIVDELVDFIVMNAETEIYLQNFAFRQLLNILRHKGGHLH